MDTTAPTPLPDPATALQEMRQSTERFASNVRGVSDAQLREPSLLPQWTRGHVVAHVAQHAAALRNLVVWARTGVETPMYPSREERDAQIEELAGAPSAELADLLEGNDRALAQDLEDLPEEALARELRTMTGLVLHGRELALMRTREVEIHHVDLGLDYTPAHWSPDFATRTLDQLAPWFLAERQSEVAELRGTTTLRSWRIARDGSTLVGQEQALLAWLLGRSDGDGLQHDGEGPVPTAPAWV